LSQEISIDSKRIEKTKKNLPDRPNIALKIESQQIKRAKPPEPDIAAYLV
jgi:hypothetical protein